MIRIADFRSLVPLIFFLLLISQAFGQKKSGASEPIGHGYDFDGNGKDVNAESQKNIYKLESDARPLVKALELNDYRLLKSIQVQQNYLNGKSKVHRIEDLEIKDQDLLNTVNHFLQALNNGQSIQGVKFLRLAGEDGKGNMHFTAYYTPILKVRSNKDSVYKFPIYRKPISWNGPRPTRYQIEGQHILENKGLELAWSSSLLDNYFLHVQGSGVLQFEDGRQSLVLFKGQNGYSYTSIGKYLVNQGHVDAAKISLPAIEEWFSDNPDSLESVLFRNRSYTFFEFSEGSIRGATGTELIEGHSIAVDPNFIPYGSILLAKVPILDDKGSLLGHKYRILTAQDRGGAIKGPGHIDLYEGIGDEAMKRAGRLHHYGSLWLILVE